MPHLPAAVLILIDRPHPDKQQLLALAAAAAERLHPTTVCHHWQDALALVLSSHIAAVVCALDPGDDVRRAIETAGGRLIVARDQPGRIRRSVNQLVLRLAKRGLPPKVIAEILDLPTGEIRRSLDRMRPRDRPPDSTQPE